MSKPLRAFLIALISLGFTVMLINSLTNRSNEIFSGKAVHSLRYDEIVTYLGRKQVRSAHWRQNELTGELTDGSTFYTAVPDRDSGAGATLVRVLIESGAAFTFDRPPMVSMVLSVLSVIAFPAMILAVIYFLLIRPHQTRVAPAEVPFAIFSGAGNQETSSFIVPLGHRTHIAWSTHRGISSGKLADGNFAAKLTDVNDGASIQLIAATNGEGSGSITCYHQGAFAISVEADVPWKIKVYLL